MKISRIKKLFYAAIDYLKTKTISDDYINWLIAANGGWLDKGNIYSMNLAIKNIMSNNPVLEIGSFCGLSTNVISYFLSVHKKNNKFYSCDKWIFGMAKNEINPGMLGQSKISQLEYRKYVKETFVRNVNFFSQHNKPYAIDATSDEFFSIWEKNGETYDLFGREIQLGGKISFCYVDGDHTHEIVKREFDNLDKYLEIGGYILFDDSSNVSAFNLTSLMQEIKHNKNYELILKNPHFLFKKIA